MAVSACPALVNYIRERKWPLAFADRTGRWLSATNPPERRSSIFVGRERPSATPPQAWRRDVREHALPTFCNALLSSRTCSTSHIGRLWIRRTTPSGSAADKLLPRRGAVTFPVRFQPRERHFSFEFWRMSESCSLVVPVSRRAKTLLRSEATPMTDELGSCVRAAVNAPTTTTTVPSRRFSAPIVQSKRKRVVLIDNSQRRLSDSSSKR